MTACNDFVSVLTLCIPRWDLPPIARISLCSKQLAQLCSAHLTDANQQQAARLLQQEVRVAAEDAAQRHHTAPASASADDGVSRLPVRSTPGLDAPQQAVQHQQQIGPIHWLLSTVDKAALLNSGTIVSERLAAQLASIPNVPSAVALLLVNAGLHVSCSQIVEAAAAGPLPAGVRVWLTPWEAWCDRESQDPLARAIGAILGAGRIPRDTPRGLREVFAKLSAAELFRAALVAIQAPKASCRVAWSALLTYQQLPATQEIEVTDLIKLMSAVVDRHLQGRETNYNSHGLVCFHALGALPVVQQLPDAAVLDCLGRAVAAGSVDAVSFLWCIAGCWLGLLPRRPIWRLSRAAVDKLKRLAAEACVPVAQTGSVSPAADAGQSEALYKELLMVLSRLPVHNV